MRRLGGAALGLITVVAVVCCAAGAATSGAGVALALVLPGASLFVLARALARPDELRPGVIMALVGAGSLGLVVLLGLVLNVVARLDERTWTASLAISCLFCQGLAGYVKSRNRHRETADRRPREAGPRLSLSDGVVTLTAAIVIVCAMAGSIVSSEALNRAEGVVAVAISPRGRGVVLLGVTCSSCRYLRVTVSVKGGGDDLKLSAEVSEGRGWSREVPITNNGQPIEATIVDPTTRKQLAFAVLNRVGAA